MSHSFWPRALAAAALAWPLLAGAQQLAYASHQLNLRAGPSPEYPVVAVLQPGVGVWVQGCLAGYRWCDVQVEAGPRGWAYAQYLAYPQGAARVPLPSAAVAIGVPILVFTLGSYWSSHYRDRPWYHNQQHWNPRPPRPPGWQPPPPPQVRPPPPRPPMVRPPPPRPEIQPPRPPRPQPRPERPGGGEGGGGHRPHGGGQGHGHGHER